MSAFCLRFDWVAVTSCCVDSAIMHDPEAALALAEHVSDTAHRLGIESALIGAAALAVHRYPRGTQDIDLAVAVHPYRQLVALEQALSAQGLITTLNLPDDDDPLGGVLSIRSATGGDGHDDLVEVVNFNNPGRGVRTPAPAAITRASALPDSRLRCVQLADLVALKLYAGARRDHGDIVQLLACNPDTDLDALRAVAAPFDSTGVLPQLIEESVMLRGESSSKSGR